MLDTLIMFDIDGTLIKTVRASKISYLNAVQSYLGIEIKSNDLNTSGKTDLLIFKEILLRIGVAIDGIDYDKLSRKYLAYLEEAMALNPGVVLPGVRSLLAFLKENNYVRLALGTGNIESGARIKLAAHRLDGYFKVGGYGTDGVKRSDILAAGIEKAQRFFNNRFQRIVAVGDTPHDIEAARENGIHSIAVATGPYDQKKLGLKKPVVILKDLSQKEKFLRIIDSLPLTNL